MTSASGGGPTVVSPRMRPVGRRVGIKDVAAAAGVSATTVSHALNGKGRLPPQTRQRVKETADALGYVPSLPARQLTSGKTGVLGITVSALGTPASAMTDFQYYLRLVIAASTDALKHRYALVLAPADATATPSHFAAVDGAIIVDPVENDPAVRDLRSNGVPLVTVGRTLGLDDDCWVDNDHGAATMTMLDHLAQQGAERPALLTSSARVSYTHDVLGAYRTWCNRHGAVPQVAVTRRTGSIDTSVTTSLRLLQSDRAPDAIFATYDHLAIGAARAAEQLGLSIPRDLLLATAGTGSRTPLGTTPSLTLIDFNPEELGRQAAQLLAKIVSGEPVDQRHVLVKHRLVTRKSTRRRVAK
jgi:DNA-binding LacI/PurR family transcriptional regulator